MNRSNAVARVDAVLFDLDGTLIDTAPSIAAALNQALVDCALPPLESAVVKTLTGRGVPVLIERALGVLGIKRHASVFDSVLARYETVYLRQPAQKPIPYPGVERGLAGLQRMGLKMGVVSNTHRRFALALLQHWDLTRFFGIIIGGDTLPERKPHPAPLLHACRALGTDPVRSLFVGDSSQDAEAAHAAHIPMAFVTYGYNGGLPDAGLGCLSHLADIGDLPDLIAGWDRTGVWGNKRVAIR